MKLPSEDQETKQETTDTLHDATDALDLGRPRPESRTKHGEQSKSKLKQTVTAVVSVLVFIIAFAGVKALVSNVNTNGTISNPSSFLNSETNTPYTSSEHGFVVNFPGFPTTEHSTLDVQGITVPYTYYSKELDNGNKVYAVQVVNYPASDFDFTGQERGSLDGAINGMAQNTGATIISSSNNGTFLGYPSASASFRVSDSGQSYDMYSVNFIKGNDMYVLLAIDESKSSFDAFVNSFKLR